MSEWHDLRKNPNDVPTDSREVLIYHSYWHYNAKKIKPEYGLACFFDGEWIIDGGKGNDEKVIAWKDIEPFDDSTHQNKYKGQLLFYKKA